jgi:hypothetical protein
MRVSKNLIEMCEILDKLGPSTVAILMTHLDRDRRDTIRSARRGVEMGLLAEVKVPAKTATVRQPHLQFAVFTNWRDTAGILKRTPANQPQRIPRCPNSVFQLGAYL